MENAPDTIAGLIDDAFGGVTAFSKVIGKRPSTASEMKRSGSIQVEYWPRIIEAATQRGLDYVDAEFLMRLHTKEEAA